jgi:methionyl-tRNA synthetase
MSKSKGTGIKTDTFAKYCNPEMLRYYFAAKLNDKVEDIDLNLEDFTQRINSDLVGKYLNILSRSSTFIQKNEAFLSSDIDEDLINTILGNAEQIQEYFEIRQYSKAIRLIMDMADLTNKYINDKTPWKLENDEATFVATTAINAFRILSIYMNPVLPKLTGAAFKSLGVEIQTYKSLSDKLISKKLEKYTPLLTRMEPLSLDQFNEEENNMPNDENSDDMNTIDIKQFSDVELRVARIISAEDIEEADKLIKLTLSVGDLGQKTVFAGIKSAYSKEDLTDKKVVLVYNLAPRKMKFGLSEGMVLASSDDNGGIFLISPDEGAKEGQRVK